MAVIFGSRSAEHDVSIITGISIIKALDLSGKYESVPIYIDKKGRWFSANELKDIALFSSGRIEGFLNKQKPILIKVGDGLQLMKQGLKPKLLNIDVVFPATHGTHGEDGELMGLLEMANIPYVGCDVPSSAIAMDKALAKIISQSQGILTSKFVWFYADEFNNSQKQIITRLKELKYPLFVKPVHLGSSIAISRVKDESELINAIEVAAHYDNKIIVEEAVNSLIEVTVPIVGNESLQLALVEQPLTTADNFFDFDTKYIRGGGKKSNGGGKQTGAQGYSKLPADLPKELYLLAENTAKDVYKAIGCSGIARIDLLIDSKAEKVYFNEINPLPGSLYAHNWREAGKSTVNLVSELVDLAKEKHQKKQRLQTVFDTNYLKQY